MPGRLTRGRLVLPLLLALVATGCATTVPRDAAGPAAGASGVVPDVGLDGQAGAAATSPDGSTVAGGEVAPGAAGLPTAADGAGSADGSASGAGGDAPAGAAAGPGAGPAASAQGGAPGTARPAAAPDGKVRVGFIVLENVQDQAAVSGFQAANSGDPRKLVQTLVDWVNANGGLGGRQIEARIRATSIQSASAQSEQAICTGFTQDDKVFAVVPMAVVYEATRACYAKAGVLLLDTSAFPYDASTYSTLSPYYWTPGLPSFTRSVKTLVSALQRTDYFAGRKVGLVALDFPAYRRVVERDYKPALAAAGHKSVEVEYVEGSSLASIQQGVNSAVVRFATVGVDRVLFVASFDLASFFMQRADSQRYRPRYGLSSWDFPQFLETGRFVPLEQLEGAVGIGFWGGRDVGDKNLPWPSPQEKPCLDIYRAAGITYTRHYDSNRALQYCSAVFLLKAAADTAGASLTVGTWAAAAERLGTSFTSPLGFADRLGPGRHDSTDAYRPLRFDSACRCFVYTGGVTPFAG